MNKLPLDPALYTSGLWPSGGPDDVVLKRTPSMVAGTTQYDDFPFPSQRRRGRKLLCKSPFGVCPPHFSPRHRPLCPTRCAWHQTSRHAMGTSLRLFQSKAASCACGNADTYQNIVQR